MAKNKIEDVYDEMLSKPKNIKDVTKWKHEKAVEQGYSRENAAKGALNNWISRGSIFMLMPIPTTTKSTAPCFTLISVSMPQIFLPPIRTSFGHFRETVSGQYCVRSSATATPAMSVSCGAREGFMEGRKIIDV